MARHFAFVIWTDRFQEVPLILLQLTADLSASELHEVSNLINQVAFRLFRCFQVKIELDFMFRNVLFFKGPIVNLIGNVQTVVTSFMQRNNIPCIFKNVQPMIYLRPPLPIISSPLNLTTLHIIEWTDGDAVVPSE
jgi:hypothetical protein